MIAFLYGFPQAGINDLLIVFFSIFTGSSIRYLSYKSFVL